MSSPQYPKYKDSGVEWLGKVPEHWELPKIKHVAEIVGGGTPSRENPAYWNGTIPWVSPKDMKSERIRDSEECITELGLQGSSTCLIPIGRVLMVIRSGILQHTLPVAINDAPVALNQDLKAFTFDERLCKPQFFQRWVQGLNDLLLLAWASEGATVESINQTLLRDSILPVPSIAEQTAIAGFLDRETGKIDELVAEQRRLIELLKEKRQAVISHAVTKGLNPPRPTKPSRIEWLGDVPKHWTRSQPKYFTTKIVDGVHFKPNYVDEGIPFVTVQNLTAGLGISFKNLNYIIEVNHEEYFKRANPEKGDVLITKDGTLGVVRVVETDRVFSIFVSVAMLKPNKELIDPWFMAYALESDVVFQQFQARQLGSALKHIHLVELRNVFVMLPPLKEQREIVQALQIEGGRLETLLTEAERAIELLQERRTALISAAVNGKIDVRGLSNKEAVA